jgi:Lamin Tail Domain
MARGRELSIGAGDRELTKFPVNGRFGGDNQYSMKSARSSSALFCAAALTFSGAASANVVINEFIYDDSGTDDREFIELFNSGADDVDISGWKVGGYDPTTNNQSTTLPADTIIPAGGFYVVGNVDTLNVNHVVPGGFLENDNETIVLRDAADVLVDALAYETNRGIGFVATRPPAVPLADAEAVAAQVGTGVFGNNQGVDLAGTPFNSTVSIGRFVDGRDTNNNGRDFGLRPATPGSTNAPGGNMTSVTIADPAPLAAGTPLPGMAGSFAPPRVIDPAVAEPNNPNVISPPSGAGSKAWVAWDPAGGGNCATSTAVFPDRTAGFSIRAFLETADLPVQVNDASPPVQFRGSEITIYGIGGGDTFTNLTDLDGSIGLSPQALPLADTANGYTGIAWIYERVGVPPAGGSVSEKLYLVDANDGGDSDFEGNTPLDWVILATYDLSAAASAWHELSITIDAAGNGVAVFDGQSTNFAAPNMNSSAFNIGYRENLQLGADGTPDALLRPPTFTFAPPPAAPIGILSFAPPTPGAINLTIPVAADQTIGIEYSNTLAGGSWIDLGNVTVAGGTGTFSDTDPGRLAAGRGFYRAFLR